MSETTAEPAYTLSDDGMTLVVRQRVPGGVRTATYHREPQAGPFTDADVTLALSLTPAAGRHMEPGQHNRSRRAVTRFGTVWTHVMTGPPTWWKPKVRREPDGTVMAGWLRLAVAVKFDRSAQANVRGGAAGQEEDAATRGTDDVSTTETAAPARPGSAAETCCGDPECRRRYPVGLYLADFSGTVYAVTKRRVVSDHGDGTATFAASERHDVTPQLREFVRRNPEFVRSLLAEN